MNEIQKYFPDLTTVQREQFGQLDMLYREWNEKINVVSRKDIDNLLLHHVLHSLAIAKVLTFKPSTRVMDLGCGGGFPGIPLAILFPGSEFFLVDSIGKKVRVAQAVADSLGLKNVKTFHARAEEFLKQEKDFDFVVSRAVMPLIDLLNCCKRGIAKQQHNALPNGIIALKGGNLESELTAVRKISTVWKISDFFKEDYFEEKKVVHLVVR